MSDNSLEAFKETLKICQDGIAQWQAQKTTNDEIYAYNTSQNEAYSNAYIAWQNQIAAINNQYSTNVSNWTQCMFNKRNDYRNERRNWNTCTVWNETSPGKHNDWCQGDTGLEWHVGQDGNNQWWAGGCLVGQGRGICGNSDRQVEQKALSACGPEPQRPILPQPPSPDQFPRREPNLTPFTLNCCSNYAQVVGSTLDSTSINQSNQCIADLEKQINDLENKPQATTPTAPTSTFAPLSLKPESKKPTQPGNFKNFIWIIVLLVFLIFSSSIISIIIMMYNETEE
jgi:hypothetical protein